MGLGGTVVCSGSVLSGAGWVDHCDGESLLAFEREQAPIGRRLVGGLVGWRCARMRCGADVVAEWDVACEARMAGV
ncbi:hypothetical protein GCM10018954_029990 [Kutzneria kofuensis]